MKKKNIVFSLVFAFFLLFGVNFRVKANTCTYTLDMPFEQANVYNLYRINALKMPHDTYNEKLKYTEKNFISKIYMNDNITATKFKLTLNFESDSSLKVEYNDPDALQWKWGFFVPIGNLGKPKEYSAYTYSIDLNNFKYNNKCPDVVFIDSSVFSSSSYKVSNLIYIDDKNKTDEIIRIAEDEEYNKNQDTLQLVLYSDDVKDYIAGRTGVYRIYYFQNMTKEKPEAREGIQIVQQYMIYGLKDTFDEITKTIYESDNSEKSLSGDVQDIISKHTTDIINAMSRTLINGNDGIYGKDKFQNEFKTIEEIHPSDLKSWFNKKQRYYVEYFLDTAHEKNGYKWFEKYGKNKINEKASINSSEVSIYNVFYLEALQELLKWAEDNYDLLADNAKNDLADMLIDSNLEKACEILKKDEIHERCKSNPTGSEGYKQCYMTVRTGICNNITKEALQDEINKDKEKLDDELNKSLTLYLTDMFEQRGIEIPDEDEFCKLLFDKDTENGIYQYIKLIVDLIRIGGPLLVIFLTAFDGIKMITSFKEEENKKFLNHLKIRLICLVLLILVPTIIKFLTDQFITNKCSDELQEILFK